MLIDDGRRSRTAGAAGAGGIGVGAGGGGVGTGGAGGGVGLGVGFGVGFGVGLGVGACVGTGLGVGVTTCAGVGDGAGFTATVGEPHAANRLPIKAIQRTVKTIFTRISLRMRPDAVNNWRNIRYSIAIPFNRINKTGTHMRNIRGHVTEGHGCRAWQPHGLATTMTR